MTETTEPKQEKPKTLTSYTVLRQVGPTSGPVDDPTAVRTSNAMAYAVLAEVQASSAPTARAQAFAQLPDTEQAKGAILVAVPTRSWVPKRRELDTKPRSVES